MKTEKELNSNILDITKIIKDQFPELSKYILEMPVTIPNEESPEMNCKVLQDYYNSLEALLNDYSKNEHFAKKIKVEKIKNIYNFTENLFEKLVSLVTSILADSITFILALCLVIYWWINDFFTTRNVHEIIGDIIFGTTFLSLFIIQKSFNKFSGSLHVKVNELILSHESANNSVINAEEKTEREISELSEEYSELAEQVKGIEEGIDKNKSTY